MKPFNRNEAITLGKPVVTRNGKKVLQLHEFDADINFPITGLMEGEQVPQTWTKDGRFIYGPLGPSENDLLMASTTKTGWVAFGVYHVTDLAGFCTHVWLTEANAKSSFLAATGQEAKGTQQVSWEE
jgi:hypothetical protein